MVRIRTFEDTVQPAGTQVVISAVAIVLLSIFGPSPALANGGPVDWTEGTPRGGLALKQQTKIRLMTEDLSIKLDNDLKHYQVTATYWLNNQGPATSVQFGVPMEWGGKRKSSMVAKDISLETGGKLIACQPAEVRTAAVSKEDEEEGNVVPTGSAWCIATIAIRSGPKIALKLAYRGELDFEDMAYTKSAFKEFDKRTLKYPLFPAGYWAGRVERLSMKVDLGPFPAANVLKIPEGAEISGSELRWELKNVDLKHAPDLKIELDGRDILHTMEIGTWNANASYGRLPLHAGASSTLRDDSKAVFSASYVVDGRPDTAWCSSGSGQGEWVEVSLPRSEAYRLKDSWGSDSVRESHTHLEAIGVVPGLAATADSYQKYARPKTLIITRCGSAAASPLGQIDFDPSKLYDESAVTLPKDSRDYYDPNWAVIKSLDDDASYGNDPCLRFTIKDTVPGRLPHTCISEITLILNGG